MQVANVRTAYTVGGSSVQAEALISGSGRLLLAWLWGKAGCGEGTVIRCPCHKGKQRLHNHGMRELEMNLNNKG